MILKNGWSSGSHHGKPPPSRNGCPSKKILQITLAAKSVVQPSSESPNQQQRPLPFLLWASYSMICAILWLLCPRGWGGGGVPEDGLGLSAIILLLITTQASKILGPRHGGSGWWGGWQRALPEPMFSVQTWMFETKKKGLFSTGLYLNLCRCLLKCLNFHSKARKFATCTFLKTPSLRRLRTWALLILWPPADSMTCCFSF